LGDHEGRVLEINPVTNEIVKDISMDGAFRLATGEGAVWVTDFVQGGLARIDPDTGAVVSRIEMVEGAHDVDVAAGVVWVTAGGSHGGNLIRIDPATNEVVATIHVGRGTGAGGLGDVEADGRAIWVTRGGDRNSLLRIDPDTNEIVATIDIANSGYWNQLALEGGLLWVGTDPPITLGDGTGTSEVQVLRIDPVTNAMIGEPIVVGYGMFGMGAGDGSLWVHDGFGVGLTQIDVATGRIVQRISIADGGSSWGGDPGIDAADGIVWMAGTNSLNRIDLVPESTP
jgi:streptogramin lyase